MNRGAIRGILKYQAKVYITINKFNEINGELGVGLSDVLHRQGDLLEIALDLLDVPKDETLHDKDGYCRDGHYSAFTELMSNMETSISDDRLEDIVESYIHWVFETTEFNKERNNNG
tara:strand:+ start:38 stop:388 length:351 start_codon:yes stop_codon:yes gene_type:complete